MLAKLDAMRAAAGPAAADPTAFFPDFSRPFTFQAMWALPVITFTVYLGLQWWAFWYPGAEPGGGGYIAQRIFSARDERNGLLSVLWYNVAHYALRPWPWILAALAVIVLYPGLSQPEPAYMRIVAEHLPHALRGVVFAGFMAAFMSTVATQLNWGASYLVADFYRRFVKRDGTEKHYVLISRFATVLLVVVSAYVSARLGSIVAGWEVVLTIGAGTGGVYLLRWYWWRINAWSEIAAMATAIAVIRSGAIREERSRYHGPDVLRVDRRNLPDQAGKGRRVGEILPEGSAPCCRLGAGRAIGAGRPANAGSGA